MPYLSHITLKVVTIPLTMYSLQFTIYNDWKKINFIFHCILYIVHCELFCQRQVRPRTFCRTGRRVTLACKVKRLRRGAAAKASLNRANKYACVDPKPGDLVLSRLKLG